VLTRAYPINMAVGSQNPLSWSHVRGWLQERFLRHLWIAVGTPAGGSQKRRFSRSAECPKCVAAIATGSVEGREGAGYRAVPSADLFTKAIVAIDGSKFKAVNNRDRNLTVAKVGKPMGRSTPASTTTSPTLIGPIARKAMSPKAGTAVGRRNGLIFLRELAGNGYAVAGTTAGRRGRSRWISYADRAAAIGRTILRPP